MTNWPIPVFTIWWHQLIVIAIAFAVTVVLSGRIVRMLVGRPPETEASSGPVTSSPPPHDPGTVIGKCENILTFIFVLSGQFEGLGLILAAKTIARLDAIKKHPSYYLGGTLVNIVWGVLMSAATHLVVFGPIGR